MASYNIDKNNVYSSVSRFDDVDGYKFKPRNNGNYVNVSQVTVVDNIMIDKILSLKFDKMFKRLVAMAMQVLNDDDETSDDVIQIVLDEEELCKEILKNRYAKYLNQKKEQLFLKKLRVIENELKLKQIKVKQKAVYLEMLEARSVGRGR